MTFPNTDRPERAVTSTIDFDEIEARLREMCGSYKPGGEAVRGEVTSGRMRVYCRVGIKRIGTLSNVALHMFVLASVDLHADERHEGRISTLISRMQNVACSSPNINGIYAEGVNDDELIPVLMRNFYLINQDTNPFYNGWCADWYKLKLGEGAGALFA